MPNLRRTSAALALCTLSAFGLTAYNNPPATAKTGAVVTAVKTSKQTKQQQAEAVRWLEHRIVHFQHMAWHWKLVMGLPLTRPGRSLAGWSIQQLKQTVVWWQHQAAQAWLQATHVPHKAAWLCIHHYEGSWTDPNAPYYGGLQMNLAFQQRYGYWLYRTKGTADHWTPLEQMWVAERAYKSRGFWPWPNTARYCGLL
ncbi:MAG TPA: hypothetical protein VEH48_00940 [Candidatus Nitrosopolaris sp.]|nr:hypothetical protein [Candidatus Nitrosopolaris sp.]